MKPSLRSVLLKVHLWLSLSLGLLFLISSLTGAMLVFRHEIDQLLNPALYRTTAGDVGFEAAYRAARQAHPDLEVSILFSPAEKGGVYLARIEGDPLIEVHVDPGSGKVLGIRHPERSLMGWIFNLHMYLLAGETGQYIVGTGGVLLLAVILTGGYLWWPGLGKLALGFKLRWRRPAFVFTYDLHKLTGITAAPVLALVLTTGVLLTYYNFGSYFIHAIFLSQPSSGPAAESLRSDPGVAQSRLSFDDLAGRAEGAMPGGRTSALLPPTGAEDAVKLWVRLPGDLRPNVGSSEIWLDQYSGSVRARLDPTNTTFADRIEETWVITLHYGAYGGLTIRILYLLAGLAPILLLATGLVIWGLKRRHKTRVRSRRLLSAKSPVEAALSKSRHKNSYKGG